MLFHKKEISIYDQYTWRPYCHVNDFSRLIIKVINTKSKLVRNQVFNAGSSKNNLTKRMLFNLIKKKIKGTKLIVLQGDIDKRNYKVSFAKLKKVLKFSPKFSIEHGIKELVLNFKRKKFKNILSNNSKYGNYIIKR